MAWFYTASYLNCFGTVSLTTLIYVPCSGASNHVGLETVLARIPGVSDVIADALFFLATFDGRTLLCIKSLTFSLFFARNIMPITFSCIEPNCSKDFNVSDQYIGRQLNCPECGKVVIVPTQTVADCQRRMYGTNNKSIFKFDLQMRFAMTQDDQDGVDFLKWLFNQRRSSDGKINGKDINAADNTSYKGCGTFMNVAALSGHIGIMECLKGFGAKVNVPNNDGDMPIHIAASAGALKVIVWLVNENGVNINVRGQDGVTALQVAASHGKSGCIKFMKEELKADLYIRDNYGNSALDYAAMHGQIASITCLAVLDYGLVEAKNTEGLTAMHCAAGMGQTASIECLANLGASVKVKDAKGRTPMFFAAKTGQIACIECLHRLGAKVEADGGPSPNDDVTPMFGAVESSQIASIECLKRLGANVNFTDRLGMSLIHYAAAGGLITSMECLKRLGARLDIKDNKDRTALDLALKYDQTEAAEWLRRNGVQ